MEMNELDTLASTAEETLFGLFEEHGLDYEIVEHPPVFTIDEALSLVPHLDGIKTKNVFARDAKGSRHFLVIIPHDRRVDLVELARTLSSTKLSMGSAERLERHLGVTPGTVSVFALVNDKDNAVELVIDAAIWAADKVQGHPLRNTATVSIAHVSLATFLDRIGHAPRVIAVP